MFLFLRAFTHDKLSLATRKTLMDALKGLCVCGVRTDSFQSLQNLQQIFGKKFEK